MAATTKGRMNQTEFRAFNRLTARNTRDLLSSGFLDTLGTSKESNNFLKVGDGIGFESLDEVLLYYGQLFVKGFAEELDKADANASGALTDDIRFEVGRAGKAYEVSFFFPYYAKFVDEGVQGVNKSESTRNQTSPYKFKFKNPSAAHVAALEKWIKDKNVTAIIVAPKGIATGSMKPKSLAYIMARAAKKRGLKATYFKKKTVESLIEDFKADVAKAMEVDIKVNILF